MPFPSPLRLTVLFALALSLLTALPTHAQLSQPWSWATATVPPPGGRPFSPYAAASAAAVATDSAGNIYLTGRFIDSVAFGPTILRSVFVQLSSTGYIG